MWEDSSLVALFFFDYHLLLRAFLLDVCITLSQSSNSSRDAVHFTAHFLQVTFCKEVIARLGVMNGLGL